MANNNGYVFTTWPKLRQFLVGFNLFPSISPSTDEYELKNERISTRLFLVLLFVIMTILLLYTSLTTITQTVSIETPTLKQYIELYNKYPQTLTCPCSKISISYGDIVSIQYSLHQVCSSDFVTTEWTTYLTMTDANEVIQVIDFRWSARQTFQLIRSFCELINNTISYSLNQFYLEKYITAFVMPPKLLDPQIHASIDQSKQSTTNNFVLSLIKIQQVTHVNALLSAQMTNYDVKLFAPTGDLFYRPNRYSNCSCDVSSACIMNSSVYDYTSNTILFTVPGMYVGCYIVESLLRSNFECFYDKTCISHLQSYYVLNQPIPVTELNQSLSSQYSQNSTVQEILDKLMIEEWNASVFYDKYYDQCQPKQCSYSYQMRNDAIYIITTLIGLVGGLTTILKIVVPRLVNFLRRKKRARRLDHGKRMTKCFAAIM